MKPPKIGVKSAVTLAADWKAAAPFDANSLGW